MPIDKHVANHFLPVKITQGAIDKAVYIAKRTCELSQEGLEVGFYLLGDLDNGNLDKLDDLVINDVCIGAEQTIYPTYCEITPMGVILSSQEAKKRNKRIIGWGHSHAYMQNFYSPTDDKTIGLCEEELGFLKTYTQKKKRKEPLDIEYDELLQSLIFSDEGKTYQITLDHLKEHLPEFNQKGLTATRIVNQETDGILRLLYGMTFNAKGDNPYCVISYSLDCGSSTLVKPVPFEIVAGPKCNNDVDLKIRSSVKNVIFEDSFEDSFEKFKKNYTLAKRYIKEIEANRDSNIGPLIDSLRTLRKELTPECNQLYLSLINELHELVPNYHTRVEELGYLIFYGQKRNIVKEKYKKLVELIEDEYSRQ